MVGCDKDTLSNTHTGLTVNTWNYTKRGFCSAVCGTTIGRACCLLAKRHTPVAGRRGGEVCEGRGGTKVGNIQALRSIPVH